MTAQKERQENKKENWSGFLRPDGRKGIRDVLLVVYTVECARFVAEEIAQGEEGVQCVGFRACNDSDYAIRLILALARHPNVGGALFVGLGCEYTQPGRLCQALSISGRPGDWFFIQDVGGTPVAIAYGKAKLNELKEKMAAGRKTESMGWSDLTLGAECGGSDATSGLVGNPLVGRLFDRLVDRGGRAVFEEILELIGLLPLLKSRAATPEAACQIREAYENMERYCKSVRQYSISPGNFVGGLSSIEEKSCGAFAKSGSRPIEGVLRVSEAPPRPGLWLLDSLPDPYYMQFGFSNPHDTEGLMDLLSTGAQILLFVTGRGSPVGAPIAPVVKITGNSAVYHRMIDDIDVDAGKILSGERDFQRAADELEALIADVCRGAKTKSERQGHFEYAIECKYQNRRSECKSERSGA